MRDPVDVAWAAGLFEGEGCIHLSPDRGRATFNRVVCVVSTDRDVIDRFHSILGIGRIHVGGNARLNPRWKTNYEWLVTSWADIVETIELLYPFLGERRRAKADEMLAHPIGLKGRQGQTHCKRNHPLAGPGSDVRIDFDKKRQKSRRVCRICTRERLAEKKLKAA